MSSSRLKPRFKKFLKPAGMILAALLIFYVGVFVGNGRLEIGRLKSENKNLPANLDYSSVEQVYDSLKQNYDGKLDVNKLLDGLKSGLVNAAGDPYTDYFNTKQAGDFSNELDGCINGIGAQLGKDKDGNLVVISPIAGSPADKAGLKAQDIIETVDGQSMAGLSIDDAVNKIRGQIGTSVKIKLVRNKQQEVTLQITRQHVCIPSVTSKILPGNIGYMQITQFSAYTGSLAAKAADSFKQAKVKGVVLDLRGDPGGELNTAVDIAGLWLTNGQTVLTTRRDGQIEDSYYAHGSAVLAGIPTAVLIDGGSASASEIVSGALHDNKAATLIGQKSFGKGSVQDVINLSNGALLKVTIARWYTPGGKNIDKQGITPDKTVDRSQADIQAGKDPQLDAATVWLNK